MIFEYALFMMICCFVVGVFIGHINSNISNLSGGYQPDGKNKLDPNNPPQGGSGVPDIVDTLAGVASLLSDQTDHYNKRLEKWKKHNDI